MKIKAKSAAKGLGLSAILLALIIVSLLISPSIHSVTHAADANLAQSKLMPGGKGLGFSSQIGGNAASNAVDGDHGTIWRPNSDDSDKDGSVWIRLDLEKSEVFDKAKLVFHSGIEGIAGFDISYSEDATNWTKGYSSSGPLAQEADYTFDPIHARYVELMIHFVIGTDGLTQRLDFAEFELADTSHVEQDTMPPVWPENASLMLSDVTYTGLTLTWPAATDQTGTVNYAVYMNDTLRTTVSGNENSVSLSGLHVGSTYHIKVEAGDAAGNWTVDGPSAPAATLGYENHLQKKLGGITWNFMLPSGAELEEVDESTWIIPGDAIFGMDDDHVIIAPTGDQKRSNQFTKAAFPREGDDGYKNLDKFSIIGYTGVLDTLEGAGYVVLLEEFGHLAPEMNWHEDGFIINNTAKLRIVFFEDGGYNEMARIIREWMMEKDYYRNIFDKPYGDYLNGAVVMRPVQYGAIGSEVWREVAEIVPKAILIWKIGDGGERSEGLENFPVELQREIDEKGEYYFLPFAGMQKPVINEEVFDKAANFDWYSHASMPQLMVDQWKCTIDGTAYDPNGNGRYMFNPYGLKERMNYWLYEKMAGHPYTYRTDGANIDTLPYWFSPQNFRVCDNPGYEAGFKEMVQGYDEMFKMIYDNGGMISHEGTAFFLEKYSHSGYGRPLLTIGTLQEGWGLEDPGDLKNPEDVLRLITENIPINPLVYHDQIAMRIHDGEALNMRYGNAENTELIRQYKFLYYALFGLTPNIQLGGEKADEWITADLGWMRQEMPRMIETYTKTYGQNIMEHKYLTDDKLVQQTMYENGVRVTANFDSTARTVGGMQLEAWSYLLEETNVSSDAELSGLTMSSGVLHPVFAPETNDYHSNVDYSVSSLTVTASVYDANARLKVNGVAAASGQPSGSIPLQVGDNFITVEVTAQDGKTVKTYTITLNRAARETSLASLAGPASVHEGQSFVVIYSVANVTQSVYANELTVHFDPEQLSLTEVDSLIEGFQVVGESRQPGKARLILASTKPGRMFTDSENVLKLHFAAHPLDGTLTSSIYMTDVIIGDDSGMETILTSGPAYEVQIVNIDRTALEAKVNEAQQLLDSASIGNLYLQYAKAASDTLTQAIASANSVLHDGTAIQAIVDQATVQLQSALVAFRGLQKLEASIGDLSYLAARYGWSSESPLWSEVQRYDTAPANNRIDIADLAVIAREILDL